MPPAAPSETCGRPELAEGYREEVEAVPHVGKTMSKLAGYEANKREDVGQDNLTLTSSGAVTKSHSVPSTASPIDEKGASPLSPIVAPSSFAVQGAVTSSVHGILPSQSPTSPQLAGAPTSRNGTALLRPLATASSASRARDVELLVPVKLHGRLPWRPQELPFAEELLKLSVPRTNEIHVWFTQIVGTPDIDAVLVCKQIGLFVIELKNWGLTAIEEIDGVEGITVAEEVKKSTTKPPWQQAFDAMDVFSRRLKSYPAAKYVWGSPAAALFNVSREAFVRKFREKSTSSEVLSIISDGVIFADDLVDGHGFIERLRYVKNNPVYRKAPNKGIDRLFRYGQDLIADLERCINFKFIPSENPTPSDLQRLRKIEQEEEKELQTFDMSANMICFGYAGTGKTVLGLQAALRKKVATLFTCFNKVLATDIRRLTRSTTV